MRMSMDTKGSANDTPRIPVRATMDYLRMDRKQDHVTCGNRLAIEREE